MDKLVKFEKYNSLYFSKESVLQYKGICALIIMLYHLGWALDFQYFRPFSHGDYVTGLFYFFSGYGLLKTLTEKKDYYKGFIRKRIFPMAFIYLIMCIVYWIYYYSQGFFYTPLGLLKDLYYNGNPFVKYSWFIISIIYFYVVFYILMRLFKQRYNFIIVGVSFATCFYIAIICKLGWGLHWYSTCLFFLMGMIWVNKEKKWLTFFMKYFFYVIGALIVCLVTSNYVREVVFVTGNIHALVTFLANLSVVFLFIFCFLKVKINIPLLSKLGKISLEVYLVHGFSIILMCRIGIRENIFLAYIFVITLTFLLASLLNKIRDTVFLKLKVFGRSK